VDGLAAVLFYELFPQTLGYDEVQEDCTIKRRGFPFVVAWLALGGLFFTLRLFFINLRMFGHGVSVVRHKFFNKNDPGEVTPFASLSAAISGTVGLGNIAGVAVAVTMGGPGAIPWMMVAGFLGMSTKFAEVTLGHKYRHIDENGRVTGGAFYYLREGLAELGLAGLGKVLAVIFAILAIGGAFGGGNMFQANQMVAVLTDTFSLSELDWVIALVMAIAVGIVLIGGVERIAQVAEMIVPLMAMVYLLAGIAILVVNADAVPDALQYMFSSAFSTEAAGGGIMGAIIMGFRRAVFSNEAGVGSSPIVFSACKSREPVQIGSLAILTPFVDTIVICLMTGLMITVTGVYDDESVSGVLMTSAAFASVIDWFPIVLSVAVALFAFSTMLTWSYYGERAWNYLFNGHKLRLYHVLFCAAVFFGGAMQDENNEGFKLIVDFSDLLLLSMAVPNLIGLYFLSNALSRDVADYRQRLKEGKISPAGDVKDEN
jgi:AGCS family alanine or glycine:cation symporter